MMGTVNSGWRAIRARSDKGTRSHWEGLQWQDSDQTRLQNGVTLFVIF